MILFSNNAMAKDAEDMQVITAYDFTFDPLAGDAPLSLKQYQGHVMLVVNTASKCGFTNQYEGLEKLYQTYKDQQFVVVGVPSDDFGNQEFDNDQEIASFCKINYGVTFPLASKYAVKGDDAHPFYKWARQELGFGTAPKWNFHKYLIKREGQLADYFHSTTKPMSSRMVNAIEEQLSQSSP